MNKEDCRDAAWWFMERSFVWNQVAVLSGRALETQRGRAKSMKTILLVDDDAHLRELVETTLQDPEYRILTAEDGQSALELALSEAPDLIVLDWMMPQLSGLAVVERLSAQSVVPPVIMLTARSQEKDVAAARSAGVPHYLVKPFSPLELLGKVREILH